MNNPVDEHAAFHQRSMLPMPSSLCTTCTGEPPDRTIDGHEVVPGLRVWDYDLRRAVVVGPQPYRNPNEAQWYDMARPDGSRATMMDAKRMWVRHPSTGEPA
jgi:hypothetical protein